jgi:hypothetical protein
MRRHMDSGWASRPGLRQTAARVATDTVMGESTVYFLEPAYGREHPREDGAARELVRDRGDQTPPPDQSEGCSLPKASWGRSGMNNGPTLES